MPGAACRYRRSTCTPARPLAGPLVDFTTINTTTATNLAARRRCSLCGEPIGYWVAFLGGPRAAELMVYADPPGCPDCMRAAMRVCPYIALGRHRRARADRPGAGIIPTGASADKPDRWLLGITRAYRSVFLPDQGFTAYLPAPFRAVHTYTYGADGRIDPHPTTRRR